MQSKILIVILTVLMDGAVAVGHEFPGGTMAKACAVVAVVLANLLALFGRQVVGKAGPLVLIAVLCLGASGCATTRPAGEVAGQVIHVGVDALACGDALYQQTYEAVRDGGASWVDVVMAGIACVPRVVQKFQTLFAAAGDVRLERLSVNPDLGLRLGLAQSLHDMVMVRVRP